MPVQSATLPLPFDDAVVVVEGRIADAKLDIEHAEDGAATVRGRSRTWVVRAGATARLARGLAIPALPSTAVIRLAAQGRASCTVTVVNDGLPAIALLDFLPLDLGPGRRADDVLASTAPAWTAGP